MGAALAHSGRCGQTCGCCIGGCGVANPNPRFAGAAGMNRIGRSAMDPCDARSDEDWFEVVSSEDGVFGFIGLMACQNVCSKGVPLRQVYALLGLKMPTAEIGRGTSRSGLLQIDGELAQKARTDALRHEQQSRDP